MQIALTMGDPYGIGPEVILKSLSDEGIRKLGGYVILGSRHAWEWYEAKLGIRCAVEFINDFRDASGEGLFLVDDREFRWDEKSVGNLTPEAGGACARWIMHAAELNLSERCGAMVTAPISKKALWAAGYQFEGHTEFLAHITNARRAVMMLVGEGLRVALVTTHAALRDVPSLITKADVLSTIHVTHNGLSRLMGIEHPRIGVCALNPHAGEGGLFGDEELKEIAPAVKEARAHGLDCSGPHPADSLFHRAIKGEFDAIVAMYHDQGLVALKLIAFETGVNVTLGLPVIRTSPDHGTAYDIAGKGVADPRSMKEAIKLAAAMARKKPV